VGGQVGEVTVAPHVDLSGQRHFIDSRQWVCQSRAVVKMRYAVSAAVCGLILVTTTHAYAEVEPGGWKSESPTFGVMEQGCGKVNGLTFTLTCATASGFQRAERRYRPYNSGAHQFEGTFKIASMAGSRISLKQAFGSGSTPYFLLAVERGGRLYQVGAGTIASGATVGTSVRDNTVHDVGKTHRTYINGSLKQTIKSHNGNFHDQFGAYRTASGKGPVTVQWSNVRFWVK